MPRELTDQDRVDIIRLAKDTLIDAWLAAFNGRNVDMVAPTIQRCERVLRSVSFDAEWNVKSAKEIAEKTHQRNVEYNARRVA